MEFLIKNTKEIRKNKEFLEKRLNIKFDLKGKKITLEDKQPEEFMAERVLLALGANFSVDIALLLLDENFMFENLNIKDLTKKKDFVRIRARVIGTKGRTLEVIEELSDCYLRLNDNVISIIGRAEEIKNCVNAVRSLVQGSKQSSIYSYLEKQRTILHPQDLGLKIKDKF